jgi:hypothetical protein
VAVEKLSISTLMRLTALLALNLAVLRVIPHGFLGVPMFVYMFAALNVALAHLLVFRRLLGVRHTVFFILGFLLSVAYTIYEHHLVMVWDASRARTPRPSPSRILETTVRAYVSSTGDSRPQSWMGTEEFRIAEGFLASLIGVGLAWSFGLGAERWLHIRGVDFKGRRWRGTVGATRAACFGLIVALMVLTGAELAFPSMLVPSPWGTRIRLAVALSFPLIGGMLGWVMGSRIRNDAPRSA